MQIRPFQPADEDAVVALWECCGLTRPWNDPRKDICRKRNVQAEWFLVATIDQEIVGSVMAGYDGHRGWVYYLGVSPDRQGQGIGRVLMTEAERLLTAAGCPKLNLMVRSENAAAIEFYRRCGYQVDEVVSFGKRLIADDEAGPS